MKDWQPLNLNDTVRVKLTDAGRLIIIKNHEKLFADFTAAGAPLPRMVQKAEDQDGWTEWHLWELMHEFGASIYMGMPNVPFNLNIELQVQHE